MTTHDGALVQSALTRVAAFVLAPALVEEAARLDAEAKTAKSESGDGDKKNKILNGIDVSHGHAKPGLCV